MESEIINMNIRISRHCFLLIVSLVLVGCSSAHTIQHTMAKEDIIDYYLEVFSANSCISGKYSEYTYDYRDTFIIRRYMVDSLIFEDEYTQLSVIQFFPNSQESSFKPDHLPPYVIEKNGILFLPEYEEWGPNHPEVEEVLKERGHYFTDDDLEYLVLISRDYFSEFEKSTYYFFKRDNPKKYKLTRTWLLEKPPKFKGVNCIHREISKAELHRRR